MTREEAINQLELNKEDDTYVIDDEALNIAIKALEQESCEDVVSRDDVVRIVQHNNPLKALEKIRKLPSVTPQEPFINKPCVSSGVCEHDKNKVLDKIDEIITDALDKSTDQKESQTLRWVLDKISEVEDGNDHN